MVVAVIGAGIAIVAVVGWDMWQRAQQTDSDSGLTRIDYNGALPGCGNPWLMQVMMGPYSERWCPEYQETYGPTVGDCSEEFPAPGWFWVLGSPDVDMVYVPVPIDEKGFARSWVDVYELACRHPQLGGTGLTVMAEAEVEALGHWGDGWYRSAGPAPNGGTNVYLLPTLTAETLDLMTIDGESGTCGHAAQPVAAEATTTTSATTTTNSSTTSTTVAKESRRYRVVVNGYENAGLDPKKPYSNGVRFDYRLIGEFTLERADDSSPWSVASKQVTTADVQYRSLYPADEYQVKLACVDRKCERLRELSRIGVTVRGNEVIVSWVYFSLEVHITGTCTDCSAPIDRYASSDYFFPRVNAATLPLENAYVGPQTISRYSNGEVEVSFAYGLELLP